MKNYLVIGVAAISLSTTVYGEELIQKTDFGIGIGIEAGDGEYYDEDDYEDNFIWIGPGWYGSYWFGSEGDFDDWHHNHWHGDHGHGDHGGRHHHHGGGHHRHGGGHHH